MSKRTIDTYNYWRGLREDALTMEPRWSHFYNFLYDMGPRPKGATLIKVDPSRTHSYENSRWMLPQIEVKGSVQNLQKLRSKWGLKLKLGVGQ